MRDYILKNQQNQFSVDFVHSRFNAEAAPPRDTSRLNIPKDSQVRNMKGVVADTKRVDFAGRRLSDGGCEAEVPSSQPSTNPSLQPSADPSSKPSTNPSSQPPTNPSATPVCDSEELAGLSGEQANTRSW